MIFVGWKVVLLPEDASKIPKSHDHMGRVLALYLRLEKPKVTNELRGFYLAGWSMLFTKSKAPSIGCSGRYTFDEVSHILMTVY